MLDIFSRYKEKGLDSGVIEAFRNEILGYYREHGRRFPWRETDDPYHLLVSEVMLQQTQTSRVIGKYGEFLAAFPDVRTLAESSLVDVLRVWQGLGYNRRAMLLRKTAREILTRFGGRIPSDTVVLRTLPGVGDYTAGAIAAIAFNLPSPFIDTNIRTVYHWFFFRDREKVADKEMMPVIEQTFDASAPRIWCFALFDYGVMLKQSNTGLPSQIKKQSRFSGSDRQIRGEILRLLLESESLPEDELAARFPDDGNRLRRIIGRLHEEGLIRNENGVIRISPDG
ncbi:MAG: A/G-specific adenine glycosylase [Dehalococcoidales bacterium]|nr:A/G-specific adenine glycosylase [Dehalococcoidales bacterium]